MASAKPSASTPFLAREFNGEVLLDELDELRAAQLPQRHLTDLALAVRELPGLRASDAVSRLKLLASTRFGGQPALGALLTRWAAKVKTEPDVELLASHLERLALTSAAISAVRRGADRLPRGGGGR